jgi:hypothetical protein
MPPRMDFWTGWRVEALKRLWMQGLTCTQIAAEMGGDITRNAIIGKVHRLKLKRSTGYENEPNMGPAPRQKTIASRPSVDQFSNPARKNRRSLFAIQGRGQRWLWSCRSSPAIR